MFTTDRQASRLAAFLQAEARPVFKRLKSARSHVCLGRPAGRLLSAGWRLPDCRWDCPGMSWMGELCAMWPKKRSQIWKWPTVRNAPNFRDRYVSYILKYRWSFTRTRKYLFVSLTYRFKRFQFYQQCCHKFHFPILARSRQHLLPTVCYPSAPSACSRWTAAWCPRRHPASSAHPLRWPLNHWRRPVVKLESSGSVTSSHRNVSGASKN